MAYLALARKWRPKTFSEVVGQNHVVKALSNALESGRVHHAFLFTGTRGVGKTTLARIFAKSLNCEQGTSAEPCQECATCTSIDEGRYVDLIEVDAASRTKVDDTRELLDNVQYAPTAGKYKVYLIDEVHMLSGHSFNALLKTLEEPPEHVKFLFATTDPQKLPVTVLSRCLQFNLRAMRPEQVENQLVKILGSEGFEYDQKALQAIAKAADGSMRDGLSLLDQAIAQGAGSVMYSDVEGMLGTIKTEHSSGLITALVDQDADQIMRLVLEMSDQAVDFATAIDDVLVQLYHISVAQIAPSSLSTLNLDHDLIESLAQKLNPERVQLYYQIALIGKRDIALAPSERVGFEMSMLRMLAFEPSSGGSEPTKPNVNSKPNHQEAVPGREVSNQANDTAPVGKIGRHSEPQNNQEPGSYAPPAMPGNVNQANPQASAPRAVTAQVPEPQNQIPSSGDNRPGQPGDTHSQVSAAPAATSQPSSIAVTLAGNNEWGELVEQTQLTGFSKELAMNCSCERLTEEQISLCLDPKMQHLFKPERVAEIQTEIQAVSQKDTIVEVVLEESDKETPAGCLERLGFEQLEQTKSSFNSDPGLKALMSEFGATINEQSVKPVDQAK
jgi:DNA polymerase-3 subunit gamma/tau